MSVSINIGGDFCVTTAYVNKDLLTEEIKTLFSNTDINIVNLECPVNEYGDMHKIIKHGPHLQTTAAVTRILKDLNITAVTLANNHLLDYGVPGMDSTINACKDAGIMTTGAGFNITDAGKHLLIEKNGLRIAIINFCENEWSVAEENKGGANPLDIIENLRQIQKARAAADKVIVIVHGGNEYYHLPSPRMVKQYRFFAENGADAVICHHTHHITGYEVHNQVPIFYGLGNFLFTKPSDQKGWNTGLTIQLKLEKDAPVSFTVIPVQQSAGEYKLSLSTGSEKEKVLSAVENYNAIIADPLLLKKEWLGWIEKRTPQYLYNFSAVPAIPGKYAKSALRRLGFVNRLLPQKYLTGVINYICCEAHLDVAAEVLKKKLYKK